jgi:hypothetical protein
VCVSMDVVPGWRSSVGASTVTSLLTRARLVSYAVSVNAVNE